MLALLGCGGPAEPEVAPEPAAEAAPAPAPATAWKVLAPSPLELAAEVKAAGIEQSLADLVPSTIPEGIASQEKDEVALQTGVVFAHTLLGGETTDKGVFLTQVRAMRSGMATIGSGEGLLRTMDRSIEQIQNDTAARADFLVELDAQVSNSVPEEGWGPEDTTGPLLQAGAWRAGLHIVAKAVVRADDAEAAEKLLRRPEVADFFLQYVEVGEGKEKAGVMSHGVAEGLTLLKEISSRETIGVDGAREAVDVTGKLLKLL